MKPILFLIATIFSAQLLAGNNNNSSTHNKYCTEMKDGKMVVKHEGKVLDEDQTLSNGTVIKTDGTVIKKDGSRTMLKEGECVDMDGKVVNKKKAKKEKEKENMKPY